MGMERRRYNIEERQAVLEAIPDHPSEALSSSRISRITGIPAMNVTSIIKRHYLPRKVHRFRHPQSNNWLYFKPPMHR
jgi:hypothetical protein